MFMVEGKMPPESFNLFCCCSAGPPPRVLPFFLPSLFCAWILETAKDKQHKRKIASLNLALLFF